MDKDTEKKSKKRDFIETTDGQIYAVQNVYELTDRNFYKVFLKNFMNAVGPVSNKKTQVIFWVLKHMTPGNEIKYTYKQIAKKTNTSYQTVATTMHDMLKADFLRRSGKVLMVNPDMIFKGRHNARQAVQYAFDGIETTAEMRIKRLDDEIRKLTAEKELIMKRLEQDRENQKNNMENAEQPAGEEDSKAPVHQTSEPPAQTEEGEPQ